MITNTVLAEGTRVSVKTDLGGVFTGTVTTITRNGALAEITPDSPDIQTYLGHKPYILGRAHWVTILPADTTPTTPDLPYLNDQLHALFNHCRELAGTFRGALRELLPGFRWEDAPIVDLEDGPSLILDRLPAEVAWRDNEDEMAIPADVVLGVRTVEDWVQDKLNALRPAQEEQEKRVEAWERSELARLRAKYPTEQPPTTD